MEPKYSQSSSSVVAGFMPWMKTVSSCVTMSPPPRSPPNPPPPVILFYFIHREIYYLSCLLIREPKYILYYSFKQLLESKK